MASKFLFLFSLLQFFLLHCPTTVAQSPAAAPAPPGPTNVTKILEKGGQFTLFIRLMKATQEDVTLNGQLNNTNNAITIFAPSDNAFSSLKSGTLNGLTDQEKAELVQFHIVPQYLSSSQFQTVTNPIQVFLALSTLITSLLFIRLTKCFSLLTFLQLNLQLQHQHLLEVLSGHRLQASMNQTNPRQMIYRTSNNSFFFATTNAVLYRTLRPYLLFSAQLLLANLKHLIQEN